MPARPQQQILVIGDSHTRALKQAHAANAYDGEEITFNIHWLQKEGGTAAAADLTLAEARKWAATLQPDDLLVLSFLGTAHNVIGLLQHEIPFEIASADEDDCTPSEGSLLVPENVLLDMIKSHAERNGSIRALRKLARCPTFHLSTPPPKEDNDFLKERTTRYHNRVVAEAGINAPATRLRLWRLEMRVLKDICASWGVSFLPPPVEALSDNGFLKREFYANDATHANRAYGALVLQELARIAKAQAPGRRAAAS